MSLNGQPNFARCLAVSWAGTLCIHFRGLLSPNGILQGSKFTLRPSLAFSYIGSVTARHSSSGHQPNFAALSRGRHLYSAGQPSRWALAHILDISISYGLRDMATPLRKVTTFYSSRYFLQFNASDKTESVNVSVLYLMRENETSWFIISWKLHEFMPAV